MESQLIVSSLSKAAIAQLREVVPIAERETARKIYVELMRLTHEMRIKHGFVERKAQDMSLG